MNPHKQQHDPAGTQPQPVAYDAQGNPLYAHPPVQPTVTTQKSSHVSNTVPAPGHNFSPHVRAQYANEPNVIHTHRPHEPKPFAISDELNGKHEASKKKYPFMNLSPGEYVIKRVRRHPIGLLAPVSVAVFMVVLVLALLFVYPSIQNEPGFDMLPSLGVMILPILLVAALVGIGGYIAVWVYLQNQMYLTNESVIQEIQHGLFSRHEQTVSLGSIEDVSYRQVGFLQTILNYGTIRLSTEGDETTYSLTFVEQPRQQVARLHNAVEDFKNGRPVNGG